uniref:Uncharacterized protein n=1 Tax=Arundo donax TaxID=35708 RepID=A0A0A9EU96_ARUDO
MPLCWHISGVSEPTRPETATTSGRTLLAVSKIAAKSFMLPALATDRSTSASLPLLLPRRYSAAALRQHPAPPQGIIIPPRIDRRARDLPRRNGWRCAR